ncbi:hypothetical protein, partial [Sphingobacterium sp. T2]|uniref:hypothetical protein n=1 Tax=Sphingobacterium sp. T2 TaxID=1590596 RepID=UPI00057BB7EE
MEAISAFNVIKGFLNISLSDSYWIALLNNTIAAADFGKFPANGKKLMVEYSSPISSTCLLRRFFGKTGYRKGHYSDLPFKFFACI